MLVRLSRLLAGSIIIAFHGFEINTVVEHARGEGEGEGKIDPTRFDPVQLECAPKVEIIGRSIGKSEDFQFRNRGNLISKILKLQRHTRRKKRQLI